jgi:hypothetical protein
MGPHQNPASLTLGERVLAYWLFHRGQALAWGAGGVAVLLCVIGYIALGPSDRDVRSAARAFAQWKDDPASDALMKRMMRAVRRVPGLELSLESEIVQTLLVAGQPEKAGLLAKAPLERLTAVSPFHAAYAKTSLLIEQREYQKALEAAVALKEKMEGQLDPALWKGSSIQGGSALFVCNLLRIACLQRQLGNGPGELAAWEEMKGLMEAEGRSSAAAQLLQTSFGSAQFTLADYISLRERSIVR